jgi:hypothetical protein
VEQLLVLAVLVAVALAEQQMVMLAQPIQVVVVAELVMVHLLAGQVVQV